jgi:type IV secretory pathway VirB3-like protein
LCIPYDYIILKAATRMASVLAVPVEQAAEGVQAVIVVVVLPTAVVLLVASLLVPAAAVRGEAEGIMRVWTTHNHRRTATLHYTTVSVTTKSPSCERPVKPGQNSQTR